MAVPDHRTLIARGVGIIIILITCISSPIVLSGDIVRSLGAPTHLAVDEVGEVDDDDEDDEDDPDDDDDDEDGEDESTEVGRCCCCCFATWIIFCATLRFS